MPIRMKPPLGQQRVRDLDRLRAGTSGESFRIDIALGPKAWHDTPPQQR